MIDTNTGNRNTGDWNTGNRNTGNRNTGDWNTGDWNTGDWNTGFFCTTTPSDVRVFDGVVVDRIEFLEAVPPWFHDANPVDADLNPRTMQKAWAKVWDSLEDHAAEAAKVRALPGFDEAVWRKITGIVLSPDDPPETIVVDGVTYRREDTDDE
jgi:hypothetical protein